MKSVPDVQTQGVLGQGLTARFELSLRDRLSGLAALVRPAFLILTPVNAASAAVLSLGGYPSLSKCISGFVAVAFASCAVNVFNDYTDRERDRNIWPARPLPSGRVKASEALLVVIVSLAISLTITWLAFNPLTFFILLLALVLGGLYSAYLRDRVGYLSLPPIVGLIYLGGWVAFSPGTLFSSWLPWYLYLLGVVWQTAHIMIYYPMHVVYGEPDAPPPALFFTPSPQAAVKIGVVSTCLTLLFSSLLPLLASLGALYLVLVIAAGVYALINCARFLKNISNSRLGMAAFNSLSVFRLVISAGILLSVFLAQVLRA